MDGVTALERSYEHLGKLAANLKAEQLAAPTPCAEWDVRGTLNHTIAAGWMFTRVNRGEPIAAGDADLVGDNPMQAVSDLASANLAAWRAPGAMEGDRTFPFGTFPAPAALMLNVGEVALHTWDLAKASGQATGLDPEIVTALYDFYGQIPLEFGRQVGAFGPEVSVPDSASTQDRLLGLLGRQP